MIESITLSLDLVRYDGDTPIVRVVILRESLDPSTGLILSASVECLGEAPLTESRIGATNT